MIQDVGKGVRKRVIYGDASHSQKAYYREKGSYFYMRQVIIDPTPSLTPSLPHIVTPVSFGIVYRVRLLF